MCATIVIDEKEYDDVGSLKKACEVIIISEFYDKAIISDENCLCCIDIDQTAEANDFDIDTDNGMIYYFKGG